MIAHLISDEAKAWLRANRERLEAEAEAWMAADRTGAATGDYPTRPLETILLAELIDCLGIQLVRPFVECLYPTKGWGSVEEPATVDARGAVLTDDFAIATGEHDQ